MCFKHLLLPFIMFLILDHPPSQEAMRSSSDTPDEIILKKENAMEKDNPNEMDVEVQHEVKVPEKKTDSSEAAVGHSQRISVVKGIYKFKQIHWFCCTF